MAIRHQNGAVVAGVATLLLRCLCATLRFDVKDRAGVTDPSRKEPFIWTFWHNRVLVIPHVRKRRVSHRHGAVLTSPSRDGEILARVMAHYGLDSERGSSSKRGASGLLGLVRWIQRGFDVAITPDGPRGPRYRLGPGAVLLAQKTGAPLMPVSVEFSRTFRLKSWDGFFIPWPFSRVWVVFEEPIPVAEDCTDLESERIRIEQILAGYTKEK